jgi:8-oxo-dGTP diphosphatase
MKKQIEVVTAIIKNKNRYYCAQRKDDGELAKKWEFPGGKIEAGETHQEALIREIREELSAHIRVDHFLLTVRHEYIGFHLIMHVYQARVLSGELTISEHLDARWLPVSEMGDYDFADADLPIIEHLKHEHQ